MPDSSAIDNALIAKLLADTGAGGLMTYTPDGVFWGEPSNNIADPTTDPKRFVIVSLVDPHDLRMFGGRAFEVNVYMVKAVMLSTSGGNIQAAAARLDDLLEGGTLTIAGYTLACLQRFPDLSRIRETEVDEKDASIRWQHRGAYWEVWASPS